MAQECGACGDVSGRVEGTTHISVRKISDGRMNLEMCKVCKLYHCPLCQPSVYKPKEDYGSVWTHIEIHRMRALKHGEFNVHVCQLKCRDERHYHCPYCQRTILSRKHFERHMDKCAKLQHSNSNSLQLTDASQPLTPAQQPPKATRCAIFLVKLGAPLQQNVTTGGTIVEHNLPVLPPAELPTPPEPPAQANSAVNQLCAPPQCLVTPNSESDQPPAHEQTNQSPSPPDQPPETATPASPQPPDKPTTPAVNTSSSTGSHVKQTGQAHSTTPRKVKCLMCNLHLNPKNLRVHNLRRHLISERDITAKAHLKSRCIDSVNGVYAVAKAFKATAIPLHVIKKKSGAVNNMLCEEDRCKSASDFRKRNNLPERQCPHLRSVDFCLTRSNKEDMKPEVLAEMVGEKMIKKDMAARCLEQRDQASQNNAPLVALVNLGGSHCLYLSVFEPSMPPYQRLFVTFTFKGKSWHCVCSKGRVLCVHRSLAKWFLFQTNKGLFSSTQTQDSQSNISELKLELPAETTGAAPGSEDPLKHTAEYIYNQKKLPSVLPEDTHQLESEVQFQKHLIPTEIACHVCQGQVQLTEPVLITNQAKIISLTGLTEDNLTFFRKCPDCQMIYRYQEWSEGFHNYNNYIVLSLQLCTLLQNSFKVHGADGGVEVLERTVGANSFRAMEVLQAYIHFEALTSHDNQSEVMMELHQKGIFNMAGIEIKGLPESFTNERHAEDFWDATCLEIIASSLETRESSYATTSDAKLKKSAASGVSTSSSVAERKKLSAQKSEECHRAVAKFLVKGLHPISTVESPSFREMTEMLNSKYRPPSSDQLLNSLIPSWFSAEKKSVLRELQQVSKAALTCDWWTSVNQDHYRTLCLHFIIKGQMMQKVLRTKQVYDPQGEFLMLEQIPAILKEFGVTGKVVAMTVDRAFNLNKDIKRLKFMKMRCFAQTLSAAAQKVYTSNTVERWASRIRAAVMWMKSSSTAQTVLQEKQRLLYLPPNSLVLDVDARWDSLYLMVERFVEQYAAIWATMKDSRLTASIEKNRLEPPTEDDHLKAKELIRTMKPLYTSTICVSADKSPSCTQIFPILKKLEAHFEPREADSLFTTTLKEKIWDDVSTCYKDGDTWKFLQESSAMDPRFKNSVESEEVWHRVKNTAIRASASRGVSHSEDHRLLHEDADENYDETPFPKRSRLTALEELFEEEDRALQGSAPAGKTLSLPERVQQEIQLYRRLPAIPTSRDALAWWWEKRSTLPLLSELSNSYLCVQASSTPQERVFSTAGDTLSQERLHILPENADMLIFLHKNS